MTPETRNALRYAEHDAQWAPLGQEAMDLHHKRNPETGGAAGTDVNLGCVILDFPVDRTPRKGQKET